MSAGQDAPITAVDPVSSGEASNTEAPQQSVVLLQPNATLYVSNIDWSIKKNILRRALLALFERHGKVLEVVTLRREGLRGQAWIIFEDISSAIAAQRGENGFKFFGKPLKVEYAREKSDRIAKRDGTYVPKDRRVKMKPDTTSSFMQRHAESISVSNQDPSSSIADSDGVNMNGGAHSQQPDSIPSPPTATDHSESKTQGENVKKEVEESPPSNILFAEGLPSECNEMMLAMLFRQYMGYKEVRIPRTGLAFIEFDDEPHATLALRGLNGFNITSADTLNLKYSK